MKTFWIQFITSEEEYQITNMASLKAKMPEFWLEQIKEHIIRSGDVSLTLSLNPDANKSDIIYALDKTNIFLLNDRDVKTYEITCKRQWDKDGRELLPTIEIVAKVVIIEDNETI